MGKDTNIAEILNKASDLDAEKYIKGIEEMLGGRTKKSLTAVSVLTASYSRHSN